MVVSMLPCDASHVDPRDAGAMCSVAESGSAVEPLHCNGVIASLFADVFRVSSIVCLVRFLAISSKSCALFPKVGTTNAMTMHTRSFRSAYIHIAVKIRQSSC